MNAASIHKFLGLRPPFDPLSLLGLDPTRLTQSEIDGALRQALGRVFAHPDGRLPEADEVRLVLRNAAAALKDPVARQRAISKFQSRPQPGAYRLEGSESISVHSTEEEDLAATNGENLHELVPGTQRVIMPARPSRQLRPTRRPTRLTDFDRHVLAVLVASGGWNANSRARLVSLAAGHRVSVEGLIKVVHGLSEYARSGGPHLTASDIAPDGRMDDYPMSPPIRIRSEPALIDRLVERVRPSFHEDDPSITIKFAVFFGAITVFAGILVMRALLWTGPQDTSVVIDTPNDLTGLVDTPSPVDPPGVERLPQIVPARFPTRPTFLGAGIPLEATDAADQAADLADELDQIERHISVSDDPAEAVYRNWETTVDAIGTGWVLMDQSTTRLVDRRIDAVLAASADHIDVPERLLAQLTVGTRTTLEPLDIWRNAWRVYTAARLTSHPNLPALVRERARAALEVALAQNLEDGADRRDAARRWLDRVSDELLQSTAFDDLAYDKWELWLSVLRHVADANQVNASLLHVITSILRTPEDLTTSGPLVNVLGRFMTVLNYRSSDAVRDGVVRLFDDPAISSNDLWILTSLMATYDTTPWFAAALVVPYDADSRHRGRLRDRVARAWPRITGDGSTQVVQGRGVIVDPDDGARWMALFDRLSAMAFRSNEREMLVHLLAWSRLNEAAGLLAAQDTLASGVVMAQLENYANEVDDPSSAPNAGQLRPRNTPSVSRRNAPRSRQRDRNTLEPPGVWAAAYIEAKNDADAKLSLLRLLMSGGPTDLHIADASVFVEALLRGQTPEIKLVARQVCLDAFARGPGVALELLDQLPDARPDSDLSEVIGTLTNRLLPSIRAENWMAEARIALLNHILFLQSEDAPQIDDIVDSLIESYSARYQALRGPTVAIRMPGSAQAAAQLLADAYLESARKVIATVEVPDSLAGLESRRSMRRRLIQGPIQAFVAEQLTTLDLLAYLAAAEQPAHAALIRDLLGEAMNERQGEDHVLRQAIEIERTVCAIWRSRLDIASAPGGSGGGP